MDLLPVLPLLRFLLTAGTDVFLLFLPVTEGGLLFFELVFLVSATLPYYRQNLVNSGKGMALKLKK